MDVATFKEIEKLNFLWIQAPKPAGLPAYEDVAVGNIGPFLDDIMLVEARRDGIRVVSSGSAIKMLLNWSEMDGGLRNVQKSFARVLSAGIEQVCREHVPHVALVRSISAGNLVNSEFLFLPLRWKGTECVLVFGRRRAEADNILNAIFTASADGLLVLAPIEGAHDFEIVTLNAAAAALLGTDENSACWERLSCFVASHELYFMRQQLRRIFSHGMTPTFEFAYTPAGGSSVHIKASVVRSGHLIALNLTDVTEMKQREESFGQLFEHNPIPHFLFDPVSLEILKVNRAVLQKYGYAAEELIGESLLKLHPDDEHDLVSARAHAAVDQELTESTWTHLRVCGGRMDIVAYSRGIRLNGRSCVLISAVDVTQQRKAEAQIAHMAHHDHLTGLANRILLKTCLDETLKSLVRQKKKAAILYLDLDDFKHVNDTLGHPVGDALLRQVAERLRAAVRREDLIARMGGDEFAIIASFLDSPMDAAVLADRLIENLSATYDIGGQGVRIGVSIGMAIAPDDSLTSEDLLKQADIALYRAKEDGKGVYRFFEAEMDLRLQDRRAMEVDLRAAMEQGQFELYYQPLVDTTAERIVACEALLRWNHPERGMVPPSEFIPLAEETGLIIPIGDWVLREACREAATWPADIKIAVNLSPVQFRSRRLLRTILDAMAGARLPACRLELEITESVMFTDSQANLEVLESLRAVGVCISMDDFGTGYSSLSYLKSFPFDKLKLDRSFIADLGKSDDSLAIIRAIALLGRSLNITTVAEGVETIEQLEQLRFEGYEQIQGYLFSRPEPAERIRALMKPFKETELAKTA
jgi:diguanylate cyclase (GGDEF)-like protein/PAS domain S-box-containing protein